MERISKIRNFLKNGFTIDRKSVEEMCVTRLKMNPDFKHQPGCPRKTGISLIIIPCSWGQGDGIPLGRCENCEVVGNIK